MNSRIHKYLIIFLDELPCKSTASQEISEIALQFLRGMKFISVRPVRICTEDLLIVSIQ